MSFWKKIGLFRALTAKTPGELATGALLYASEDEKENKRKNKNLEQEIEWKQCSNCKTEITGNPDYCPNCGTCFKENPKVIKNKNTKTILYDINNNEIGDFDRFIGAGIYNIGKHIEAGEYLFYSPKGNGYYAIGYDADGEMPEFGKPDKDEMRITSVYLNLLESCYINIMNGYLINTNQYAGFQFKNVNGVVMYRIGIDLPVGKYILKPKSGYIVGHFRVYTGPITLMVDNLFATHGIDKEIELDLPEGTYMYIDEDCDFQRK